MATTDIDSLFKPSSASIRQLLSDSVGGFSIPPYQRPYRWKPTDIKRLCEDLVSGLDRLEKDPSAVSFIGTIITVSGIDEDQHKQLPSDPRQVIDGQQRLTTLVMIAVAAHDRLRIIERDLPDPDEFPDTADWLTEQLVEVKLQLFKCLGENREYGDEGFLRLPKIIRERVDAWSTKKASARYVSPAAHLIFSYFVHVNATPDKPFRLGKPTTAPINDFAGSSAADHKTLDRRFKLTQDILAEVANGTESELSDFLDLEHLVNESSHVLKALFQNVSKDTASALRTIAASHPSVAQAMRILLFARFMLERMALTQINAKEESYAFDLFDSLNTTGAPLTALETFVPLVVQAEGRDNYATSVSADNIAHTMALVARDDSNIQRRTERFLTAFLLADGGLKVPAKHNEQRRELTARYKRAESLESCRKMTSSMADTAECYFELWESAKLSSAIFPTADLEPQAQFSLLFLNKINHTVVVAPIARYYSAVLQEPDEKQRIQKLRDLESVIRMCAAYSIIWRTAKGGTYGIDARYRKIMSSGIEGKCGPLCRTHPSKVDEVHNLPSPRELGTALRESLAQIGITGSDSWVSASSELPIYANQAELSRVLLLLAGHHAIPDGDTGLTKSGTKSDSTDMFFPGRYVSDDRYATLEHVAPQSPKTSSSWDSTIYTGPKIVDRIGNLTLLPLRDNSFVSNMDWADKRAIYAALSCDDPDEAKSILAAARATGLTISDQSAAEVVKARQNIPHLRSVATFEGAWDADFVRERGRSLLARAWSILECWLKGDALD